MKFLIDESSDARFRSYLNASGHDATSIAVDHQQSLPDDEVLAIAVREQRILITNDRDFGELIFRQQRPHCGVIFFRTPPPLWSRRSPGWRRSSATTPTGSTSSSSSPTTPEKGGQ